MAETVKMRSWRGFVTWCDERGLCSAPANAWTLSAYIRYLESTMTVTALRRHIGQVGQMHYEKIRKRPDRHEDVQRTLDGVRARKEAKKKKVEPDPPLFRDEDFVAPKGDKPKPKAPKKAAAKKPLRATPKLVRRKRV